VAALDMQGIYDLVGDRIRDLFDAQVAAIATFDHGTNTEHFQYVFEGGERYYPEPRAFDGIRQKLIETRELIVFNEDAAAIFASLTGKAAEAVPGTVFPKSALFVPLVVGESVRGYVSLQNLDREHAFSDAAVRLLSTLANSMSIALENARLFDETTRLLAETEQRNAELAVINSVQEGLVASLDIQGIYDLVGDRIRDLFDAQVVVIATFDHRAGTEEFSYVFEDGKRFYPEGRKFNEIRRQLIDTRQLILINENAAATVASLTGKPAIAAPGTAFPKSVLYVPLVVGESVRGYVSLQNLDREHAFSDADVRLLSTLANSMSVALENARLFDETTRLLAETEQRNAELAVINSVQEGLVAELDMQGIYDLVGGRVRELFDAHCVMIGTFDHEARTERFCYLFEHGDRHYPDPRPYDRLRQRLIETRELILINENADEVSLDILGVPREPVPGTRLPKSLLYVPLIVGDTVRGYVSLQNLDREQAFSAAEVRLLSTLANSMSVALENARLFDETNRLLAETEQRAAELGTVNTISRALVAQLDLDALVHLVGEQMRTTFTADIVYLALLDRGAEMIEFPYVYGETLDPIPLGEGLTSRILRTGEPLLINSDFGGRTQELGVDIVGTSVSSYLGVPIMVGTEATGVISVQSVQEEEVFGEDDLRLLSTIAANVGIALQNAQSYQKLNAALAELKRTQTQLVQQEKLASLGAHEIKNPLNFINNFGQLTGELAEELREELGEHPDALDTVAEILSDLKTNASKITEHGRRADSIVRSMLLHSRHGTGQRESVDLNALVEEYVNLAYHGKRAQQPGFNVEVTRELDPGVGEVEVVSQDLGRVVLNLVGNAFDAVTEPVAAGDGSRGGYHGPSGGHHVPTVSVSTRRAGEHVEIRVRDNGPGIPAEIKERIFEPFFTTKPAGSGTGLGLSMSHEIVTQGHGGTLAVDGASGRGTTFTITLPVTQTVSEP
jgi:signal transduction histidine kinase/uncharacterized protein YigA (DUF484 family)